MTQGQPQINLDEIKARLQNDNAIQIYIHAQEDIEVLLQLARTRAEQIDALRHDLDACRDKYAEALKQWGDDKQRIAALEAALREIRRDAAENALRCMNCAAIAMFTDIVLSGQPLRDVPPTGAEGAT